MLARLGGLVAFLPCACALTRPLSRIPPDLFPRCVAIQNLKELRSRDGSFLGDVYNYSIAESSPVGSPSSSFSSSAASMHSFHGDPLSQSLSASLSRRSWR